MSFGKHSVSYVNQVRLIDENDDDSERGRDPGGSRVT
jgi:hypothetical protein